MKCDVGWSFFFFDLLEELTAPRELTNEPMVTTPSPVLVSTSVCSCVCVCVSSG